MPLWLFFTTGRKILPLPSLCIFDCIMFDLSNLENVLQYNSTALSFYQGFFSWYSNIPIIALPFLKALFYTCTTLFDSLPNHIKNAELKRSVITPCLVCTASTICSVMSIVKPVQSKPHKSEQAFKNTLSIHALCI